MLKSRLFQSCCFSIALLLSSGFQDNKAFARTFTDPDVCWGGYCYPVHGCITSYRFRNSTCSKNARNEIAYRYCLEEGYEDWESWQVHDYGWNARSVNAVRTEEYVNGKPWKGWKTIEGGWKFNMIECS